MTFLKLLIDLFRHLNETAKWNALIDYVGQGNIYLVLFAIILARFVPIVRTFAPFVAGVGKMNFFRFWLFNIIGGVAWVLICILGGVYFGKFEFVQKHFELVIVAIVIISILPMVIEYLRS